MTLALMWREFALTVRENGVSELYRGFYSRAVHCLISDLIYYYTYTHLTNRKLESLMKEIAKKKDAPRYAELATADGADGTHVEMSARDAHMTSQRRLRRKSGQINCRQSAIFRIT